MTVPILSDTLLHQARRRAQRRSAAEIAAHSRDHTLSIQAVALYLRLERRERVGLAEFRSTAPCGGPVA